VRVTDWWEPHPDDPVGFVEWLRSVNNFDATDPGVVSPGNRRWLRRFFEAEGPTSAEVAHRAFRADQVTVAGEAASAVLSDLRRTTSEQCAAAVEKDEWGSARVGFWYTDRITGNRYGGFAGSPVWEIERAEVFAEVADEIQDQLLGVVVDGMWRCWPECRQHNAGLHAQALDDRAVWWCRMGEHELAPIGQLGENGPTP
jgi:hypothetical protein